jgi:hypothetical protein
MIYKTVEDDNFVLRVEYEEAPESPRTWGPMGTIVQWHRRWSFGDINIPMEKYETAADVLKGEAGELKDIIYLPLYIYDHGGIVLNTTGFSCPWDSGQCGWIFVAKDKVRESYGVKRISMQVRERVLEQLRGEIEVLSEYVQGNVFWYSLEDKQGKEIDSCGGFIGYDFKNNGMADHLHEYKNLVEML